MIYYHTDNTVSIGVKRSFEKAGIDAKHIREFNLSTETPIFYGILRGTGAAIRTLQMVNMDFYYVDNGYYDAVYMGHDKKKDMHGEYRVVKNGLIETYTGKPTHEFERAPMNVLLLPPSPYAAFMHDTTPEDWMNEWITRSRANGDNVEARKKDHKNTKSFAEEMEDYDALVSMNSMSSMEAARMGKAVYDTHGIFKNAEMFDSKIPYYEYDALEDFYRTKQFTLEEIGEGKWTNN